MALSFSVRRIVFFELSAGILFRHLKTNPSPNTSKCLVGTQLVPNLRPLNSKISELMRNGHLKEAEELFDGMNDRSTVTLNAMIRGYFINGSSDKALRMFESMECRDIFTYNTVITGLMRSGNFDSAREVFDRMMCKDIVSWNAMISGYVKNGLVYEGVKLFDEMEKRDVVSWNLVISGLVNDGKLDLAEEYFERMHVRDVASWTIMITGYMRAGRVSKARGLFDSMPEKDVQTWNKMIAGYIQNDHVELAEDLLRKMPNQEFDSWNEMIRELVNNGRISDAVRIFLEMPNRSQKMWNGILFEVIRNQLVREAHTFLEKTPFGDVVSWTNVIVGYFELGEVEAAAKVFESMPTHDTTAWNATICGLGENDRGEEGLKLYFRMMEQGSLPDDCTFTTIMAICTDLPAPDLGRQTHSQVIKLGFDCYISVSNAMVTMYARCGNMQFALQEFSSMQIRDIISWNSIICGYAHHGNGEKSLEMFQKMRLANVKPNLITFIGVLTACSHAGLVEHGKCYFNFMKYKCFIQPTTEHYTCLVDLLGRCGLINEVIIYVNQMEHDGIEVSGSVWGALFGACRKHKNITVGEIAGERVLEVQPNNSGIYMILAEMYLNSGRTEDAERILVRMKERGVKKQPGCSWIEVNNAGHVFLSGDESHPAFCRIGSVLDLMHIEMDNENHFVSNPNQLDEVAAVS